MLALTLVLDKDFVKIGENIFVKVGKLPGTKQVRLYVEAPKSVPIIRSTYSESTLEEGRKYFNLEGEPVAAPAKGKPT